MTFQFVALALSGLLLAGQGMAAAAVQGSQPQASGSRAAEQAWQRTHRASKILGTRVRNRQGEKIGDIKDLLLDANGHVAYAVVSTGGFLGVADRLHAIPWAALQKSGEGRGFVLDIDRARLGKAPGFDAAHWPDMSDERWNEDTRSRYPAAGR